MQRKPDLRPILPFRPRPTVHGLESTVGTPKRGLKEAPHLIRRGNCQKHLLRRLTIPTGISHTMCGEENTTPQVQAVTTLCPENA
jgi:hypothetical protein